MTPIKLCPYCGNEPRLIKARVADVFAQAMFKYKVKCEVGMCPVKPETGWHYTDYMAKYEWNTMPRMEEDE